VYNEQRLQDESEMSVDQRLDRTRIEQAFRIMGQYLLDRKVLGEIAIYGGSAILFQFDWRKTSQDVDARVISDSNHGFVIEAVREAAKQLGLPLSWLSESVSVYTRRDEGVADRVFVGVYPSPERFGLRVTAAQPAYILAMKLSALERSTIDDRDYQDAISLALECGVSTVDELHCVFHRFFAGQELSPAAELRMRDLALAIQARPAKG
jgi:hypothetical protein